MDIIIQLTDESDTVYNYRLQFIEKIKDKFDNNQLIIYSKIAANMKFKNMRYDSKIYNLLKDFI